MRKPVIVAGRTAVITGAGSGMGRCMAQLLSRMGCSGWRSATGTRTVCATPPTRSPARCWRASSTSATAASRWPSRPTVERVGARADRPRLQQRRRHRLADRRRGLARGRRVGRRRQLLGRRARHPRLPADPARAGLGRDRQHLERLRPARLADPDRLLRLEVRRPRLHRVAAPRAAGDRRAAPSAVHPGGIATNIVDNARFYVDDRGSTDHEVLKSDFDRVARTSPEKAAAKIIDGVERGRQRILVGPDAYAIAGLVRAMPVRYFDLVKRIEPLIRR